MKTQYSSLSIAVSMGLTITTGLLYSSSATSAEGDEVVADKNIEKIAVVGSRAAPRSISDSPVPIDIIGGDELGKNGSSDMLEMLVGAIPSFNVRAQPISDAATLIRPVNLRGLSSDSTLVLLNGKRRHRASVIAFQGGGVNDGAQGPDISVIPSIAIKQVEVLRDGAAAQYGSDAIAGVMNFVLKDSSEGGSISVKTGEYFESDGNQVIVDGNIGMPFTDNGFANLSFQFKKADATSRSVQRPDADALFNAGNSSVISPAQIWGNPEIEDDVTFFGNVGFDVGNDKEFYMFGNYSERDVTGGFYYRNPHNRGNVFSTDSGGSLLVGDVGFANDGVPTCSVSNAYVKTMMGGDGLSSLVPSNVGNVLDTAAYTAMVADPNCFSMNQIMPGGYTPAFGGNITDTSLAIGTKGEISSGFFEEWYYDLSGSVGRNESAFNLKNTLNPSMGLETPTEFDTGKYIQLEKSFNFDVVKGIDFGLDEPVNVALGLEWREESFEIVSGEEASWKAGPYADQGFNIGSHGFKGFGPETQGVNTRRSFASYVDLEAYLTEDFLIGTAIRYEDFTSFGSTINYKITAQYTVTDDLSLRASHSTGFRAPTVGQANVVNTQTSLVEGELIQTFLAPPTAPLSAFYGGKELDPEESVSYAAGIVVTLGEVFLTADYYNIEVTDRIAQSSQIDVLAKDYTELEALGVVNPELISAVTYFANDFDTTTQGIDLVANYAMDLFNGSTKFSLAYNWNETTVDKFNPDTVDLGKVRRLEEGMPDHRGTFTIAQDWDEVSSFIRFNYFGEYFAVHADDAGAGGWNQTADTAVTLDAEISYYMTDQFTLSIGGNNILDQEAEELPQSSYGQLGAKYYESGPFDYNGGFYYAKLTYNF
ncbi:TonB-dependent receptor [Pseudoalteromonas sp. NBT06-2]|uniref:TonB-dependent receptor plug domain-containing protein n=1 Tax=Pseudoalteromonas sp. NBT06-2 TaxID=2025950 RepID=UPI000BA5EA8B|nr:TonB-dependent receptor [Pseudoalteromonas sp. NBT06-2]PAJ76198.1 TonB-dependent receptor [Pseudoalteromonas sp. NBT06-2]